MGPVRRSLAATPAAITCRGWRRVFERAFGHETVYLAAREHGRDRRRAAAGRCSSSRLFGRFAVSLPFVNYGGVSPTTTRRRRRWSRRRRRAGAGTRRCRTSSCGTPSGCSPQLPARTHKVDDAAAARRRCRRAMWDGLDRKVRNQVRKAEKSGLTWRRGGAELLDRLLRGVRAATCATWARRSTRRGSSRGAGDFPGTAHASASSITAIARSPARLRCRTATCSRCHGRRRCASTAASARTISSTGRSSSTAIDSGARPARLRPLDAERRHVSLQGAVGREARAAVLGYAMQSGRELPNLSPSNPKYRAAIQPVDAAAARAHQGHRPAHRPVDPVSDRAAEPAIRAAYAAAAAASSPTRCGAACFRSTFTRCRSRTRRRCSGHGGRAMQVRGR